MNPNQYLTTFFSELERLIDGGGTRHCLASTPSGKLEVRFGAGDWYWAAQVTLDDDPVRAAQQVAKAQRYFPTQI